jgi:hypothetical protein
VIVAAAIPLELTSQPRWIGWSYGPVDLKTGKPKKEPWRLDLTRRASSTKPRDWGSFDDAIALVEAGKADGAGFALPDRVYTLVDLDDVVDGDGNLHPAADEIVAALGSYSEWSATVGAHVLVEARLNGGHCQTPKTPWGGKLEVWDHARFVYLTGDLIEDTPPTIELRQAELDQVYEQYFAYLIRRRPDRPVKPAPAALTLDDQELLERAYASAHGEEIRMLYAGAWQGRYQSQSEADLALCRTAAFWTGRDPARIDAWMRSSGLMRDKWERADYRERTIETAIAAATEVYTPRARDTSRTASEAAPAPEDPPFVDPTVTFEEFVARTDEHPREPLITTEEQGTLAPAGALILLVAITSHGKTTLAIEFIQHASAGIAYNGLRFARPLSILVIQNEGPRDAFREKLEARLAHWDHGGKPRIWDVPAEWGQIRVSNAEIRAQLRRVVEEHHTDLIVSDSLTRFGVKGNGTPEETREFIELLTELGLGRHLAFMLLTHPRTRTDPGEDELEQIAGAWQPHADLTLLLKKLGGGRARLSFPKTRWARGQRPPSILAFDPATESFTYVGDDVPVERDYVAELAELMADGDWWSINQLRKSKKKGGVGASPDAIKEALQDDRFESATGAKIGMRAGTYHRLREASRAPDDARDAMTLLGPEEGVAVASPPIEREGIGGDASSTTGRDVTEDATARDGTREDGVDEEEI